MTDTTGLRTWIEVDTKKLKHNLDMFRAVLKKEEKENGGNKEKINIMAVVKSNAYGHGLVDFSKEVEKLGVDWLGVDSITEGLRLRKEGIMLPILVLGYTLPERVQEAVMHNISLTVSSLDALKSWVNLNLAQAIKIHIKVDTGLHRQGFLLEQKQEVVDFLKSHESQFGVEGLYTHFAQAKDPASKIYTENQLREFNSWIEDFKKNNFSSVITHAAATAGTLNYPNAQFDMVRIGAGLYGIWPSEQTKNSHEKESKLEPILTWRTLISEIKKLPKGSGIGYDLSETLEHDSVIAICPVGYWHGYSRNLSGKSEVLIHQKKAKILGKIAMDMLVIDVTEISNIKVHDTVTLLGSDDHEKITVEELAHISNSTAYEFLTRLNPLIKRLYI